MGPGEKKKHKVGGKPGSLASNSAATSKEEHNDESKQRNQPKRCFSALFSPTSLCRAKLIKARKWRAVYHVLLFAAMLTNGRWKVGPRWAGRTKKEPGLISSFSTTRNLQRANKPSQTSKNFISVSRKELVIIRMCQCAKTGICGSRDAPNVRSIHVA